MAAEVCAVAFERNDPESGERSKFSKNSGGTSLNIGFLFIAKSRSFYGQFGAVSLSLDEKSVD